MNFKFLMILSVLISANCFADSKPEVYRDKLTLTGGVKGLSDVLDGCEAHSGLFTAKRFQYSDSGNTIKLIQFSRGDGEVFAIPTNFDQLDKGQYADLQRLLEEGRRYWVDFSVCGSAGFTSLMGVSYSIGM